MAICSRTSTGIAPLDDLAAGPYLGRDRGLFALSNDIPIPHRTLGVRRASAIEPLDSAGAPSPTGKIMFADRKSTRLNSSH